MLILIISIFLVVIFSGIVSGTEAAIISLSFPEAKEILTNAETLNEKQRAERLLHIKNNLQKYITTIVILNNIINIVGSMFIGYLASQMFGNFYMGIISAILTFLIILFSEIIPKIYGEKYDDKIAPHITKPLIFMTALLFPLVWFLNKITNLFIDNSKIENNVSEGVIREMAILGKHEGSINTYESDLIKNVFEMNDTEVYDIMVPRNKVEALDAKATFKEIFKLSQKTGHTRFPVIDDEDEVIGMVNVKDLFKFFGKEKSFDVKKILRVLEFAPEAMKISTLEQKLRRNKTHMAAIFNEHGDFTGIVTLEDIFEELVGEIHDEFDNEDKLIKKIEPKKYHISSSYDIEELDEKFNLELNLEGDFSTLNGFIINKLGRIPNLDEVIVFGKCSFKILKANNKQILNLELVIK